MGYQESLIKFKNKETLIKELKKYEKRDKSEDIAGIVCIDRVKKAVYPFKEGELVAVVCGERSEQRDTKRLKKGLGITNVQDIVFIDNPFYWEMAMEQDISLGEFLGEHFQRSPDDEYAELLM